MGKTQDHQASHALAGKRFSGLYNAAYEHDACGVGMVVNIHGNKSHELVDNALRVLENMRHRGAEGADNKTGDGAGIMLQIPHEYCCKAYLYRKKANTAPVSFFFQKTRKNSRPFYLL